LIVDTFDIIRIKAL